MPKITDIINYNSTNELWLRLGIKLLNPTYSLLKQLLISEGSSSSSKYILTMRSMYGGMEILRVQKCIPTLIVA